MPVDMIRRSVNVQDSERHHTKFSVPAVHFCADKLKPTDKTKALVSQNEESLIYTRRLMLNRLIRLPKR